MIVEVILLIVVFVFVLFCFFLTDTAILAVKIVTASCVAVSNLLV